MLWPAKCGKTKAEAKNRDTIDVTDPAYLRSLPKKTLSTLDGRVTCILTTSEKILRHVSLQKSEADEVALLETPRIAKGEQILEDALRQLQVCASSQVLHSVAFCVTCRTKNSACLRKSDGQSFQQNARPTHANSHGRGKDQWSVSSKN